MFSSNAGLQLFLCISVNSYGSVKLHVLNLINMMSVILLEKYIYSVSEGVLKTD